MIADLVVASGTPFGAWSWVLHVLAGLGAIVLALWIALVIALWRTRPTKDVVTESLRLFPDVVRLTRALAGDGSLPRAIRWRLVALGVYLALPIDLVPDFIPILGQADDVLVAFLVLRSVARQAGPGAIRRHWPGTPTGLAAVWRAAGLPGEP